MGLESLIQQQSDGSDSKWGVLEEGKMMTLSRQISIIAPAKQIDVFGAGWGITLGHPFEKPIIAAVVKAKPVTLIGRKIACFFPPQSIVEWSLQPGSYHFEAVFSDLALPKDLPLVPIAFETSCDTLPKNFEELFDLVRGASSPIPIMKEDTISSAARKMKHMIEQSFLQRVSIATLAARIGFNHATIVRAFGKAYGMTPVRYRSKLRVYSSLRNIVLGHHIKEAASKCGYHDLSQYNRQFKREMSHSPSAVSSTSH